MDSIRQRKSGSVTAPGHAARLRAAGLRPTRQRIALAALLFDAPDHHITAEELHAEAERASIPVSLATVYNTLHQFTSAGLLREVSVDGARTYFDTNTGNHHHFYCEDDGSLTDIESDSIAVAGLPEPPPGSKLTRVDVIIRVSRR